MIDLSLGGLLKRYRKEGGFTQQMLACLICSSESMVKKYESNEVQMPADLVVRAADILHAPVLKLRYCYDLRLGVVNTPVLDSIDDHPMTVLSVLETEAAEFAEDVRDAQHRLANKRGLEDLSDEDAHRLDHLTDELEDMVGGLMVLAVVLCKQFGRDLGAADKRYSAKCHTRGYIGGRRAAALIPLRSNYDTVS